MLVREYTEADLDALRRMHARQGFDYAFPDLADPIFVSKLVVEDDDGRTVMASLARLTCEMYLLLDREDQSDRDDPGPARRSPLGAGGAGNRRHDSSGGRERFNYLLALHRAGERDLLARGLDDAHAWTPYCRRLREP